jgi:diaminopimelate epimerase
MNQESDVRKHLPFVKMSGAGNDFIVLASRDMAEIDPGWLAARICTRGLSLGADGIIIVSPRDRESVEIRFYNPDGSVAEMCGNGSRCAARYAVENRLVEGSEFSLLTDSGALQVRVEGGSQFHVMMPESERLELDYMTWQTDDKDLPVHAVTIGVPHCVVPVDSLSETSDDQLIQIGRALRHHEKFPYGVNTNFVELRADSAVRQRTYERGVENLTKACGTGATAIAHVLTRLGEIELPVDLVVDGGRLRVSFEGGRYWLSGDTRLIATGVLSPEALEWSGG